MKIDRTGLKILVFYDEPGWAWWHRAHNIKRHVSSNIVVDILKVSELFDHVQYDFILLFESYLYQEISHVPQHKVILGSSTLKSLPGAVEIYQAGHFAAFVVNNLESYNKITHLNNVYCCQNGVSEVLFSFKPHRSQEITACWVGNNRSINNKGLDIIREACQRAGVKLVALDQSENIYKGKVLTQEQLRDEVYHKASFYICASEMEGTPNPALESLSCGLPVISTCVGNMPEVIVAGYNGYLVVRNVVAIVEAIEKIKQADLVQMSLNARQSILSGWTWKQQAGKYEKMFTGVYKSLRSKQNIGQVAISAGHIVNHTHTQQAEDLSSSMFLSVVITTYNRPMLLDACLSAFANQSLSTNFFEIIVVEDGSEISSIDIVKKYQSCFDIKYIYQKNAGLAAARNTGISLAKNPIIVPYDDDNAPSNTCLEACYRFHQKHPSIEDAMLAFMQWQPGLEVSPLMHYITEVNPTLWCYRNLQPEQLLRFGYLWGGCSSYKKALIEKAGGFNPIFRFGYEDTEAELRMRSHGLNVYFEPQALNYVLSSVTYEGFCRRVFKQGQSLYRFAAMYPDNETVLNYAVIKDPQRIVAKYESHVPDLDKAIMTMLQRGWGLRAQSSDPAEPTLDLLYQLLAVLFDYWKNKGIITAASEGL